MVSRKWRIEDYEYMLKLKVERRELRCPKCGNEEDFMVNELGHVFCNRCFEKLRFVRWNE